MSGGIKISLKCDNIQFPNHPHLSRRVECKTALMKQVKVGKQFKLIPRKYFVYNSIASSLTRLMSRPGFLEQCEAWRKRGCDENFMTDVYDGKIWKDWQKVSVPYLEVPGNLLVLNVDWFRPFKHTPYSPGVIYLVIQNLPRTVRFKPENIIIVGTIPGPSEPKLHINSYIKPMIDELLDLWKGVDIQTPNSILEQRKVRVALAYICSYSCNT